MDKIQIMPPPMPADEEEDSNPEIVEERLVRERSAGSKVYWGDMRRMQETAQAGFAEARGLMQRVHGESLARDGQLREEFAMAAAALGGTIADVDATARNRFRALDGKLQKLGPLLDAEFAKRDQSLLAGEAAIKELGRLCGIEVAERTELAADLAALDGRVRHHNAILGNHEDVLNGHADSLAAHTRNLGDQGAALNEHLLGMQWLSGERDRLVKVTTDLAHAVHGNGADAQEALSGLAEVRSAQTASSQEMAEVKGAMFFLAEREADLAKEVPLLKARIGELEARPPQVVRIGAGPVRLFLAALFDKTQDLMDGFRRVAGKAGLGLAGATAAAVLIYTVSAYAFKGNPEKTADAPAQTAAATAPAEKQYQCKELSAERTCQGGESEGWVPLDCGVKTVVCGNPQSKPPTGNQWPKSALRKISSPLPQRS
jgi:hypothetical protein